MVITDYQAKYFAQELTIRHAENGVDKLSQSLFDASVDLNPHQMALLQIVGGDKLIIPFC
ncbi:hypothetical protein [Salmonella enterica]|uniref:hypothetical protein n=1 Tax=Salmonella enterica TaxID=28901 RepID=UPI0012FE4482|nr:hypothetical protein [Salmonella enterica]